MPRNLYKRGAVWWGRAQIAGAEHRRSLRTGDRAEAARRFKAWRADLTAAAHFGMIRRSWAEAVTHYVAEVLPRQVKPSTGTRYISSLRTLDPILGALELNQIDQRVIAKIAARKGPTNATRRRDLTAVAQVLRSAVAAGWIEHNPARSFDRGVIRERRDPIQLPTDAEIMTLANACRPMLRGLVLLLWQTGLRLEEAGALERRQVDLNRKAITLERTKSGRARTVPLSAQAVGTLQSLPVRLGSAFVFWHGDGDRYRNLSSQLAAIERRAGVTFRRHDLRHRFAVDYLQAGGSIYDLQQILGHSSIKTTEGYLDHLTPDEQRAAKRLGER